MPLPIRIVVCIGTDGRNPGVNKVVRVSHRRMTGLELTRQKEKRESRTMLFESASERSGSRRIFGFTCRQTISQRLHKNRTTMITRGSRTPDTPPLLNGKRSPRGGT